METNTFIIKALAASAAPSGMAKIVLTDDQIHELYIDLGIYIDRGKEPIEPSLHAMRSYFLEKEGYMESDRICINYWNEHHE